jgi:hypothetical protein
MMPRNRLRFATALTLALGLFQGRDAFADEEPTATTESEAPGARTLDVRLGWGPVPDFQQHSVAFSADLFLMRRLAVRAEFAAFGDTVAYDPARTGRDYSNGGSLLVTYVLTARPVLQSSVLETYVGLGGGALATRPRTSDPILRAHYTDYGTVDAAAGLRLLFAQASVHLDVHDSAMPARDFKNLFVPRLGLGVSF